ncbi:hypothetical protein KUTeg_023443 [Tegillarca granosa]|uniref:C2H2-type domain-containing protein n=1 Tax=Tegillarca granosa TaxID=220873 RepID=A0ABQ9E7U4_TEGGR|nr:hypothetical protein KUTeg_023443 [Tegillarca granosa]
MPQCNNSIDFGNQGSYFFTNALSSSSTTTQLSSFAPPVLKQEPYYCNICGKSFPRAKNLSQHRRLHSPPKLQCNACGRRFRWKMSHARHVQTCKANQLI